MNNDFGRLLINMLASYFSRVCQGYGNVERKTEIKNRTPVIGAPRLREIVFVALTHPVPGAQSSAVVVHSLAPAEVLQTTLSTTSAGTPVYTYCHGAT